LHSSDYARALDLLQKAAAEFPNDAELTELEKLAQDGVKRKTEAHRLMTEGQELCAKEKPAEGIKLLREAYELDENNPLPAQFWPMRWLSRPASRWKPIGGKPRSCHGMRSI
jgi:tetratricopeptide (TPR) repeat protein